MKIPPVPLAYTCTVLYAACRSTCLHTPPYHYLYLVLYKHYLAKCQDQVRNNPETRYIKI